jgi:hypothetical protein
MLQQVRESLLDAHKIVIATNRNGKKPQGGYPFYFQQSLSEEMNSKIKKQFSI